MCTLCCTNLCVCMRGARARTGVCIVTSAGPGAVLKQLDLYFKVDFYFKVDSRSITPFFQSRPRRQNRPPSHRRKKRHHAAFFPPPNHVQTLPCSSPVPQHHFPRDGDREDAIFAMIPPRKLKISPRRGSWTGNGALEAVDGVQGRLTAPWRRQRPATLVACPVGGLAGLYDRTAAENKG